jgi:hypothetical protein
MALATGAALLATAPVAANAAAAPSVTATPHTALKNGQTVKVTAKNFTAASSSGSATAAECSHAALKSKSINDCDIASATPVPINSSGNGTAQFKILTGSSYSDTNGGKCGGKNSCIITVVDNPFATTQEAAATISFTKAATHTKVSGKSSVAKGSKLKLTIKTTHKASGKLSGKVTITANGHKLAKVKEPKSGKISLKVKFKKTGKEKIVAKYGGNKKFKASSGTKTVKVTK